jgi:GxxExxY protein
MKELSLDELNKITEAIIGAAIEVHRTLGPSLLESAYQTCLAFELIERGYKVEQQKPLPLFYKNVHLDCGYRLDLLVNEAVIVEIKAVDQLAPIHEAHCCPICAFRVVKTDCSSTSMSSSSNTA